MKNRLSPYALVLAGAIFLSACASSERASHLNVSESRGADPVDVQINFVEAVVEVCGNYFLNELDINGTDAAASLELTKLKAGSRYQGGIVTGMPVYASKDGIVHIKENLIAGRCEVSAYGIPVSATFESTAQRLLSDNYVEQSQSGTAEKTYRRVFEKEVSDITISVVLTGNEPGATGTLFRFSTLLGLVSFRSTE